MSQPDKIEQQHLFGEICLWLSEQSLHPLLISFLSTFGAAGEKELVVLGDFGSPPQSSELDILKKEKLCALVPSNQFTNISTRSPQGNRCLDNIWVSRSLKKIYSGR